VKAVSVWLLFDGGVASELSSQPRPCLYPVPSHRSIGEAQGARRLFVAVASKEPTFNNLSQTWTEGRQALERIVDFHQVLVSRSRDLGSLIQRQVERTASPLLRDAAARVVHQHVSHSQCRGA